jgi:ATP-binding cassette, subfamily B, multidrug efflux pump
MARSQLQKLGIYLHPHRQAAILGITALFVVNGLAVSIPFLISRGVDQLQVTFSYDQVITSASLVLLLATIMFLVRMVSRILLFGVGRQVEFDLKQRIFNHLLLMEPAYFAQNTIGDLINRSTSDVDNIRRLLGFAILSLANTIFAYALTLPAMMRINGKLTLLALSVYPVMLGIVNLFSNKLRHQQLALQEELSNISELIQEDMSGMALIKIYGQEENERRAFRQLNQRLLTANLRLAQTRTILFPTLQALAYSSGLLVLAFGAGAIENGELSVGDFIALLIYVQQLAFPTALLGFTITAYQRGEVSIDRVEAILSVKPQIRDAPTAIALPRPQLKGRLTAKNLVHIYPAPNSSAQPVLALDHVNFAIAAGETVAIVGPIGSGKSTLANTFPRLLNIAAGQLFVDDFDVTQVRLQDLRGAIAYVPQESFLFSTSMQNNIRYGVPLTEPLEVQQVAKLAQIHDEILNFPQEYETIVGERGITLSGGQRQRTALARALLVDAPILILDDALSSVDNQTATRIIKNLSEGTARKTVIFISHQLSAAAMADRIFVMEQGKIVQAGAHNELFNQPGLYQTLWQQNQLEEALK